MGHLIVKGKTGLSGSDHNVQNIQEDTFIESMLHSLVLEDYLTQQFKELLTNTKLSTLRIICINTNRQDSLFCLYSLMLSNIVARNISFSLRLYAPSLPPVPVCVVEYLESLSLPEAQVFARSLVIVEEGDITWASGYV